MALTRKFLAALGIEAEKIDEIIDAHTETVNALKKERDEFKESAEKLPDVEKELSELKEAAEKNKDNPYKAQYEDLKKEYDDYKADVDARETKAKKTDAYRKLLKEAGVSEKRIDSIVKVSDIDSVELDKDGHIKDFEDAKKRVKEEWADFITTEEKRGANTNTPPAGDEGKGHQPSRAAEIAKKYMETQYGIKNEGGNSK